MALRWHTLIMFGRVRRAAAAVSATEQVTVAAVLGVYSPETIGSVLAVGMGAAGVGSGAAIAQRADGTQVSAMADAVTEATNWGRREQRRYLRLPGHVLVLITTDAVIIREWTHTNGMGCELTRWPRDTFDADPAHYLGKTGVRAVLDSGKIAILSGDNGPLHRKTRATVGAILSMARAPAR